MQGRPTHARRAQACAALSSQVIMATPSLGTYIFQSGGATWLWGNAHAVFGSGGSDLTKTTNHADLFVWNVDCTLACKAEPRPVEVVVILYLARPSSESSRDCSTKTKLAVSSTMLNCRWRFFGLRCHRSGPTLEPFFSHFDVFCLWLGSIVIEWFPMCPPSLHRYRSLNDAKPGSCGAGT